MQLYETKASKSNTTRRSYWPFIQHLVPTHAPQHVSSLGWHSYLPGAQQIPAQQSSRLKTTCMCVQSCSGSGWDWGLFFQSFLLVSFFKQEVDIGQSADACASVAVLDEGPSHWTHMAQNSAVSIHLYLIPTFMFGSSTRVLYLPEKGWCSHGIEQEPVFAWVTFKYCMQWQCWSTWEDTSHNWEGNQDDQSYTCASAQGTRQ